MASETYWELRGICQKRFGISSVNVGDEGGPPLSAATGLLLSGRQAQQTGPCWTQGS